MSFKNTASEPKSTFLNNLINEHFNLQKMVYTSIIGERTPVILAMHGLATFTIGLLPETDSKKIDELIKHIEKLLQTQKAIERPELLKMYTTLTEILNRTLYSTINLGLVPSGAVEGNIAPPEDTQIYPNRSARI